MPNPLMLATATQTKLPKPEADLGAQPESDKTISFQDILTGEKATEDTSAEILDDVEIEGDGAIPDLTDETPPMPVVEAEAASEFSQETEVIAPPAPATSDQVSQVDDMGEGPLNHSTPDAALIPSATVQSPISAPRTPSSEIPASLVVPQRKAQKPPALTSGVEVTTVQPKFASGRLSHPVHSASQIEAPGLEPDGQTQNTALQNSPKPVERAPTIAQMQVLGSANVREVETVSPVPEIDGVLASKGESSFQTARETTAAASPSQAARAEVTRAIVGQIAAAIQVRPGPGAVEIALNPEELGRVSIVFNGREDGLHMTIAVERPETLELMRRHIAVLTSEFQKLGLGDLSLDLGGSSDSRHEKDHQNAKFFDEPPADAQGVGTGSIPRNMAPAQGIDMRL